MDKRENEYVLWFDELRRADVGLVGGKSSSLGELTSATKVPVPYGYATTANAYRYFMDVTGQNKKIHELLEGLDDVEDSVELHEVCTRIRQSIMDAEMPADLAQAIADSYDELAEKVGEKDPFVAVRSSATAEDLPDASFAGQQDTYLNVHGKEEVIRPERSTTHPRIRPEGQRQRQARTFLTRLPDSKPNHYKTEKGLQKQKCFEVLF